MLNCSFCAKDQDHVQKLVAGPGVYICNNCVDLCVNIIASEKSSGRVPEWSEMTDQQMLDRLPHIASTVAHVEESMDQWVGELRRRGVTWGRIGEKLGIARQSAWERFTKSPGNEGASVDDGQDRPE